MELVVVQRIFGLLSSIGNFFARRREGLQKRLERELATKADIASHIRAVAEESNELIIRELRRNDSYPDIENTFRGISPWFKVEYFQRYYGGIEVLLRIEKVSIRNDRAREAKSGKEGRNVYVVGRIPYGQIEGIDWAGDNFYSQAHVYCRFRGVAGRKGPYESIQLYDSTEKSVGPMKYHEHLEGVRWKPRRRGPIERTKDRRYERKVWREYKKENKKRYETE